MNLRQKVKRKILKQKTRIKSDLNNKGFCQRKLVFTHHVNARMIGLKNDQQEVQIGYLINDKEVSEEQVITVMILAQERAERLKQYKLELEQIMVEYLEKARAEPNKEFVLPDFLGHRISIEMHGPYEVWRLNSVRKPEEVIVTYLIDELDKLIPPVVV